MGLAAVTPAYTHNTQAMSSRGRGVRAFMAIEDVSLYTMVVGRAHLPSLLEEWTPGSTTLPRAFAFIKRTSRPTILTTASTVRGRTHEKQ